MAVVIAGALLGVLGLGLLTFRAVDIAKARRESIQKPSPATWWEQAVHHQVWIHMNDNEGRTVRGFVKIVAADGVLLADGEYLDDNGAVIPLGGEVFIPRERVSWVQIPPALKGQTQRLI